MTPRAQLSVQQQRMKTLGLYEKRVDGLQGPATDAAIDALLDFMEKRNGMVGPLTLKVALELVEHEAIVQEAYLDNVRVWTWAIGLTKASGIDVLAFKDRPASIRDCLIAYVKQLRAVYIPAVLRAFEGHRLTEAQFAAALSFHYNTGAIERAGWVHKYRQGQITAAREAFMDWRRPASIIERRERERDLFFDGIWSHRDTAMVVPVAKPSYTPSFAKAKRVDIRADLAAAIFETA